MFAERSQERLIISHRMLGHLGAALTVSGFIALVIFVSKTPSLNADNIWFSIVFALVPLLCLISTLAAYTKRMGLAFTGILAGTVVVQLNGAFLGGYSIYAPSLMTGFVPIALAFALFRWRQALLCCAPVFAVWAIIFGTHGLMVEQGRLVAHHPPANNLVFTLITTFLAVVCVLYLYARQAESAIDQSDVEAFLGAEELKHQQRLRLEREQFMGQLSHEIRTPIAALRNAVALLNHANASPEIRERSLKLIDRTSANLLELLNDALDSFKFGSQQFVIRNEPFDLKELLDEVHALFAVPADSKDIALVIDQSGVKQARVMGDAMRLRQMLSNLVGNAVKFTDSGEVRVTVVQIRRAHQSMLRFEVSDTGRGIAPEQQAKLFKPFSQVGVAKKGDVHGTGLGLSIVMQLAQAMGGTAGVHSKPGEGSTFWFEVQTDIMAPLAAASHEDAQAPTASLTGVRMR